LSSFVRRESVLWLAATVALLLIGLLKTINLLTLLGCALFVVWLLNAVLARRGLRRLRGRRWIAQPIFAGTPAAVTIEVHNTGRQALPTLRLEDGAAGQRLDWFVPALGAGGTVRCSTQVTLPDRGHHAWNRLVAVSRFPFGVVRREVTLEPATEVIVWPRLGRLHRGRFREYLPRVGQARDRIRREARRHPTAHTEFHGLRAFRSGDSPRWIHWRTSARCGELKVREFEDVPTDDLILVVDPCRAARTPANAPCPDLETVLSLAATICWEYCRQRGDRLVLILAGAAPVLVDGVTGPEHVRDLLDCLAGLQPEPCRALDPNPLLRRLTGHVLPAAPVLVLGAGPSGLGEILGQQLQRPVAVVTATRLADLDCYEPPPKEIRTPKLEIRNKSEIRNPNTETGNWEPRV
jgi:uncharacterized protein (DUF58 family)